LSGAVKSKTLNRNGDISVEEFNKRHSTVSQLPIPSTISKDTMVCRLELIYSCTITINYIFILTILVPNLRAEVRGYTVI